MQQFSGQVMLRQLGALRKASPMRPGCLPIVRSSEFSRLGCPAVSLPGAHEHVDRRSFWLHNRDTGCSNKILVCWRTEMSVEGPQQLARSRSE